MEPRMGKAGEDYASSPTHAPPLPWRFCRRLGRPVAGQQCVTVGGLTAPANGPPAMPSVGLSGSGGSNTAVVARGEGVCNLFADSPALLGSDSGVAQWKGTSFATAFVSGNAARSNQGWPPQTVLDDSSPCGA